MKLLRSTCLRYGKNFLFVLVAVLLLLPLYATAAEHSFRIRFGLTDSLPTTWDGSVSVSGGSVANLRSWRPREADVIGADSWKLATVPGRKFGYRNWEPEPSDPVPDYLNIPGLVLTVKSDSDARIDLKTAAGNFSFRLSEMPVGTSNPFLHGAVVVEQASNYHLVSDSQYHNGFADIVAGEDGTFWTAWAGYREWGNHVFIRHFNGETYGDIQELTTGASDVYYVRLASLTGNKVVAVWSDQKDGNFDLYSRFYDGKTWSTVERLTTAPQPDIHHALATDPMGRVWLVWQGFRGGISRILMRRLEAGNWLSEESVSLSDADAWHPAITTDSQGTVFVAWETYQNNDYDIEMRSFRNGSWTGIIPVANTLRYEAYPSLACDAQDRLWVAWNESGLQWGKDTGFLLNRPATQLYQSRWVSTAVYENSTWREPLKNFKQSLPEDLQGFNDFPKLVSGAEGRVWMLFRHRHLRQREVPHTAASHRASWETYATSYDGLDWSMPIPLPATAGRSDAGYGFSSDATGALYAAWATDNRVYDEYFYQQGDIFASKLPQQNGPLHRMQLKARVHDELKSFQKHPNEKKDIARIRDYEIKSAGKSYRIYRGDTHRHTEYSGDGNNDGSQNDTYRYALNVADLDYLGMSEHHNSGGPNIDYINWLLQQRVDVFSVPGRFMPLYGYERGVGYPNGHRNIFFSKRGNPTFPDQPNERETSTASVGLYKYLKQYNGISIPHTPATGMGTDWRDNDPEVEPLVEIYQGDRVSAEYEGAPKSAIESDLTGQAGGYRPKGYVWNAWAKGYKIGVQASSDHLSTHISYSCTIAEEFSREGLLDAMKKRHNYAATDNIVLDYRMQAGGREYLQGDVVTSRPDTYELSISILGTAPVRQVDIIRDQDFIYTLQNQSNAVQFRFKDKEPPSGETYYYVRVQQTDGQMAWSSPIWITNP